MDDVTEGAILDALPTMIESASVDLDFPTPMPDNGWPPIERDDPEGILRGLSIPWMQAIWKIHEAKVPLIEVFNQKYSTNAKLLRELTAAMKTAILKILPNSDPQIIPPEIAPGINPSNKHAPTVWAVRGLNEEQTKILTDGRIWAFKSITFMAYSRTPQIPKWVLSLEGFLENNQANIEATVDSVFYSPNVYNQIVAMARDSPDYAHLDPISAAREILNTLKVTVIALESSSIVANVYIDPPTRNIATWRAWVAELRKMRFGIYLTATAYPRPISWCAGCRSADHPAHLCPFPALPGWRGPQAGNGEYAATVPALDLSLPQASSSPPKQRGAHQQNAQSSRGFHPRGRGRGAGRGTQRGRGHRGY